MTDPAPPPPAPDWFRRQLPEPIRFVADGLVAVPVLLIDFAARHRGVVFDWKTPSGTTGYVLYHEHFSTTLAWLASAASVGTAMWSLHRPARFRPHLPLVLIALGVAGMSACLPIDLHSTRPTLSSFGPPVAAADGARYRTYDPPTDDDGNPPARRAREVESGWTCDRVRIVAAESESDGR